MSTITLTDFQLHLDSVINRVRAGERLVILRDGQPVAELCPVMVPQMRHRPKGLCAGQFVVPDDFNSPLPEDILKDFEDC